MGGSTVQTGVTTVGEAMAEPEDPTRGGFEFNGWYTDAQCTQEYDFETPVTTYFDLFAGWKEKEPVPSKEKLADYSWEEIKEVAEDISAKAYVDTEGNWKSTSDNYEEFVGYAERGDVKELDGVCCFRIVDLLHDEKANAANRNFVDKLLAPNANERAGLTFMGVHAMEAGSA